jgi:hypothetical protein
MYKRVIQKKPEGISLGSSTDPLGFINPIMAPFVEAFYPENISSIVTGLWNNGTAASFCLGTADRPPSGKECVIYAV